MDLRTQKELERAKEYFYSWQLLEAYNILRRFFDRLPFKQETEHAEYIGIFVRTLLELGKDWELKFYISEVEKLYQLTKSPELGYQLATVYIMGTPQKVDSAKKLFERVIQETSSKTLRAKAKIFLAYCYDLIEDDVSACEKIIASIEPCEDSETNISVQIWKAKILRDQRKYGESEVLLKSIIKSLDPKKNWYSYFTSTNILAIQYLRANRVEDAKGLIAELRTLFEGRKFKIVKLAIDKLEREIQNQTALQEVVVTEDGDREIISYANKKIPIKKQSAVGKLLLGFLKAGFLNRNAIVNLIYQRGYKEKEDNKLVYYHIHSLRKFLAKIGIPEEAISLEEEGYRWMPKTRLVEAES